MRTGCPIHEDIYPRTLLKEIEERSHFCGKHQKIPLAEQEVNCGWTTPTA
ncbi:MAG: hypothetical protein MK103_13320 [Planctomycetes bacterium]|nr:hypothetical protein [Planctomycetota bacterium]